MNFNSKERQRSQVSKFYKDCLCELRKFMQFPKYQNKQLGYQDKQFDSAEVSLKQGCLNCYLVSPLF